MADASVTRIVVSNAARLDFDSNLSWDALEALGEVTSASHFALIKRSRAACKHCVK